eukprot:GHVU01147710.1.p1 GENE.GHVU01147710.1~~GHVU01147710.1.p1  ORF type:complete len:485 (-),score=75.35 GHVU01147710.1:357-1811(-)
MAAATAPSGGGSAKHSTHSNSPVDADMCSERCTLEVIFVALLYAGAFAAHVTFTPTATSEDRGIFLLITAAGPSTIALVYACVRFFPFIFFSQIFYLGVLGLALQIPVLAGLPIARKGWTILANLAGLLTRQYFSRSYASLVASATFCLWASIDAFIFRSALPTFAAQLLLRLVHRKPFVTDRRSLLGYAMCIGAVFALVEGCTDGYLVYQLTAAASRAASSYVQVSVQQPGSQAVSTRTQPTVVVDAAAGAHSQAVLWAFTASQFWYSLPTHVLSAAALSTAMSLQQLVQPRQLRAARRRCITCGAMATPIILRGIPPFIGSWMRKIAHDHALGVVAASGKSSVAELSPTELSVVAAFGSLAQLVAAASMGVGVLAMAAYVRWKYLPLLCTPTSTVYHLPPPAVKAARQFPVSATDMGWIASPPRSHHAGHSRQPAATSHHLGLPSRDLESNRRTLDSETAERTPGGDADSSERDALLSPQQS